MWYLDSQPSAGSHEPVDGRGRRVLVAPGGPAFVRMHAGMVRLDGAGVKGRIRARGGGLRRLVAVSPSNRRPPLSQYFVPFFRADSLTTD